MTNGLKKEDSAGMEQVHTGIPRKFSGRFYGTGKSRHTVKQTNR